MWPTTPSSAPSRSPRRTKADAAERKAGNLERDLAELSEVGAQREKLRRQLEASKRRVADLEEIVADQRELLGSEDGEQPAGKTEKRARRTKLEDEPNIYLNRAGDQYEVGYWQDGKQRWKLIGPDLDEARRARDELRGKEST